MVRIDGGGGNQTDINWLLERNYRLLVKMTHWKRVQKLANTVIQWHTDPKDDRRQAGWIVSENDYAAPARQLAVRCLSKKGKWRTAILVFNLTDDQLRWVAQQGRQQLVEPDNPLWLAVYAYDLRAGGVETAFRNAKQGLGITKRNKKSFQAQEMLLLLGQLAYNFTVWIRAFLSFSTTKFDRFGTLRMVRDLFHLPGKLIFDSRSRLTQIIFNQAHDLAAPFVEAFSAFLPRDGTVLILRQI